MRISLLRILLLLFFKTITTILSINPMLHCSRLMRISLLRILLLRFFKTITIILLMRFYGLFILLVRS